MKLLQQKDKLALFLIILALLSGAAPTFSQTTTWTDLKGDWFTPGNWSGGVPNFIDDTQINNGGTANIGSAGATAANLYLRSHLINSVVILSGAKNLAIYPRGCR